MLFNNLMPLLTTMSLGLNVMAAGDDRVSLVIIPKPKNADDGTKNPAVFKPLNFEGTPAELDAALAQGANGPLGQLFGERATLAEQIVAQREETEAAQKAAKAKATAPKPKPTPSASATTRVQPAANEIPEDATLDQPGEMFPL